MLYCTFPRKSCWQWVCRPECLAISSGEAGAVPVFLHALSWVNVRLERTQLSGEVRKAGTGISRGEKASGRHAGCVQDLDRK